MEEVTKLTEAEILKYKAYWGESFNVELLEKFKLLKAAYKPQKLN